MRYFGLPDDVAAALYRSLATSTDTPATVLPPPAVPFYPPAPAPAAPAAAAPAPAPAPPPAPMPEPVRPKSELETIMAGVEYTPAQAGFPNGWPTPARPQPTGIGNGEGTPYSWIATGSKGGGYYAYRTEKPLVNINTLANPRSGLGLLAVLMEVGLTQEFRNKAYNAIIAGGGNADIINANLQADPTWNAEVRHVLEGVPPNTDELRAAKAVADAL